MKYINKNNEAHANPIIDDYLTIARAESYDADHLYKQFGSFSRKNELIDNVLLPEQDNLCCYVCVLCQIILMLRLNISSGKVFQIMPLCRAISNFI